MTAKLPGWLSYRSAIMPVWLWHALFDGSRLCWCAHSGEYRRALAEVPRG